MSAPRPDDPGTDDAPIRWCRSDRALFRRIPDGVLVLLLPDGRPELIAGPGGPLWDLLARPRTRDELTAALAARYDHDPDVVGRDLGRTLDELHQRHLVTTDR